jgi:BCD family chlorophyll transporter-like MFS transporter
MADVLLEPYGGQVLGLTVGQTTSLTAILAGGTLAGFTLAWRVIGGGANPVAVALAGAAAGIPAFGAIIAAAAQPVPGLFTGGVLLAGFGAGLFGHGTLTATIRAAPRHRIGLALGAWGAVQATSAGLAIAAAGVVRDLIVALPGGGTDRSAAAYINVFAIEIGLLALALLTGLALLRKGLDQAGRGTTSRDGTFAPRPGTDA